MPLTLVFGEERKRPRTDIFSIRGGLFDPSRDTHVRPKKFHTPILIIIAMP
jgi:hypothetical protein